MIDRIITLQGPDRVRKRAAVIFGSDGIEGAQAAVRLLTDIFASEALLGYCGSITVCQDNADIFVNCDDRGLYLGQNLPNCHDIWNSVFCELYPGLQSGPSEDEYHFSFFEYHHGLYFGDAIPSQGVFLPDTSGMNDLCMLQYACEEMNVTVVRDGLSSELNFRCGYNVGGIRSSQTSAPNGTHIHLRLDPSVFSETVLTAQFFKGLLSDYAMLIPGLKTEYTNRSDGSTASFCFLNGLSEYVSRHVVKSYAPIYAHQATAIGKDRYNQREYQASVKVAMCFVPDGATSACYHNLKCLQKGGTHIMEIKDMVCTGINAAFGRYIADKTGIAEAIIQPEELEPYIHLMVDTRCSRFATQWKDGARQSIRNIMIKDMAHDLFSQEFENYVYSHKKQLQPMIDAILTARTE